MTSERVPERARSERFLEEGRAFAKLTGLPAARPGPAGGPAGSRANEERGEPERFDVVVIGGGQSGLAVGHHLARSGLRFVILDASPRIGDAWRSRWDSLRLFTPARFDGLPGMPFPGSGDAFPTKDEMGDYLERYAARFDLPVRSGVRVEGLARNNGCFVVSTSRGPVEADQVVVAMANYQRPKVPAFAGELRSDIAQFHSAGYRSPAQLQEGDVLIVGAGNSGAEIAAELAGAHRVWLAGRDTGHVPFRIDGLLGRLLLLRLVLRFVFHRVLTVRTPAGRTLRPKVLGIGGPLIRVKPRDLAALGVERLPRMAGVEGGLPRLDDGRILGVANVVWCTGFHPGFDWIDLPVFDEDGRPRHQSGVAADVPGLYFAGLHFLHALSSGMIHGVARDAERVARAAAAMADRNAVQCAPRPPRAQFTREEAG
jgi:putative flavoprotein involved in K+ transport